MKAEVAPQGLGLLRQGSDFLLLLKEGRRVKSTQMREKIRFFALPDAPVNGAAARKMQGEKLSGLAWNWLEEDLMERLMGAKTLWAAIRSRGEVGIAAEGRSVNGPLPQLPLYQFRKCSDKFDIRLGMSLN